MKFALITDIHFGARNDSLLFLEYFGKFFKEIFFPYLEQNNIKTIINLGDTFEKRTQTNTFTLNKAKEYFFQEIYNRKIEHHAIVGNHDIFYRESNKINTMRELIVPEFPIYLYDELPEEIEIENLKILMTPWINNENEEQSLKIINDSNSDFLFAHMDIKGFSTQKGRKLEHGYEPSKFSKFDLVGSGHIHWRSTDRNITYFGCPYQWTWNDFGNDKGFHVVDTVTRKFEFIKNPLEKFKVLTYNDLEENLEEVRKLESSSTIKVIVEKKEKLIQYEEYIKLIEETNPFSLNIVETEELIEIEENESPEEVENTENVMNKEIENMSTTVNKEKLKNFMLNLYKEALTI